MADASGLRRRHGGDDSGANVAVSPRTDTIGRDKPNAVNAPASDCRQVDANTANASVATDDDSAILRPSWHYHVIKALLTLVIFIVLHTIVDRYILSPFLRPVRHDVAADVMSRICPAGLECDFSVDDKALRMAVGDE